MSRRCAALGVDSRVGGAWRSAGAALAIDHHNDAAEHDGEAQEGDLPAADPKHSDALEHDETDTEKRGRGKEVRGGRE